MTRLLSIVVFFALAAAWSSNSLGATLTVGNCPGATHSSFAAAYNQLGTTGGGPHTLRLCPNQAHTTPPVSARWGHAGLTIESVSGSAGNTSLTASGNRILTASSQDFTIRNLALNGNLTANGYSNITLDGVNLNGSTSTNGNLVVEQSTITGDLIANNARISLTDSQVDGNVVGRNGITSSNTDVNGNVTATNGEIELNGGTIIGGNVLGRNGVTSSNTDITGSITATNGEIDLNGGTIDADIDTDGNNQPISLNGVTMTGGSAQTAGNDVTILESQIGGPGNPVPITANNDIDVSNSQIWGDLTAGIAIDIFGSEVFGDVSANPGWKSLFLGNGTVVTGICTPDPIGPGVCGPPNVTLSHIRLEHPETGLTCSPATITVKACAEADCTSLSSDPVDVDFTSPVANWTPDPVTFTGSAQVPLQYTTPEFVTLDAVAIDPAAANPTRCFTTGGVETNCGMQFFDSGFEINIPDHVADSVVNGTIAAVRSDPGNPEQCAPGFSKETKDVSFWSQYFDPGTGSLQAGIDGSAIATGSPGTGIPIAFDSSGVGSFQLQYPDVGRVAVNARYVGSGDDAGLVMTGQSQFVARPAYFTLDIPGNEAATDETGDVFMTAGREFEITVAARNASNGITPNFGQESTPESVELDLTLFEPSGGVEPALDGNFGAFRIDCEGNSAMAGTACGKFTWPEIGIISLEPRLASGAYLGTADVVGTAVDHVGRFIPDHFELSSGRIIDRARPGLQELSGCSSDFTYIGEPFNVEFTIRALNAKLEETENYKGDFAFLGGGDLNLSGSPSPDINDETIIWLGGVGDASAHLTLPRSSPEGPYPNYGVTTAPVDSDGVALLDAPEEIDTTKLRYGRIVIDNAIGSELGPLDLPWRAEYWDGDTWLVNEADECTKINLLDEVELYTENDSGKGTSTVSVGGGNTHIDTSCSVLTLGDAPSSCGSDSGPGPGKGRFRLTAPGSPGWVRLLLKLDDRWSFLQDDLEDPLGTYEDNPEARASFGLFDGNSQRIYIREISPR